MIIINHFYYLYVYVCADIKKKFCCFPMPLWLINPNRRFFIMRP